MRLLANIVLFQIGWFACVLGAAYGMPLLGTGVALLIVGVHVARASNASAEFSLVLLAGAFGFAADSALVQFGLLSFPAGNFITGAAPHWMVALWMVFATTLNTSLAWLKKRLVLAAALGAIAGPAAYLAGARLGALQLLQPTPAFIGIALVWAVALPLLLECAIRLERRGLAPVRPTA